jgi:hypothetical protein
MIPHGISKFFAYWLGKGRAVEETPKGTPRNGLAKYISSRTSVELEDLLRDFPRPPIW